jgi:hypothetical protein
MTFRCEICYKTFEIGVLIYPLFDCDSPTKLCGRRDFRVLVCYKIFVFSNGNVPGLKHTNRISTG